MIFYIALFLAFLYFKIARVHKKEEKGSSLILSQHLAVGLAVLGILLYGVLYIEWYLFIPFLFVFATIASLMITSIQLGIFVNGKPIFGLTRAYRYLPFLSAAILSFSSLLWVFKMDII